MRCVQIHCMIWNAWAVVTHSSQVCLLLEDEDVVITAHVCSCYLDDVGMRQLAKHLELMLCMGVANLNGEELGSVDLLCGVVLTLSNHTELTSE